jgi:hypothetical protein
MVAERVSRRVIRLLSPDSIFPAAKIFPQNSDRAEEINLDVTPELPGLRFVLPREKAVTWLLVRERAAIALAAEYRWA